MDVITSRPPSFKCTLCPEPKRFVQKQGLLRHHREKHQPAFCCSFPNCYYKWSQSRRSEYKRHLRMKHGLEDYEIDKILGVPPSRRLGVIKSDLPPLAYMTPPSPLIDAPKRTSINEPLNPVALTTAINHGLLPQTPPHSNGQYAQDTHPPMPPPPHHGTAKRTVYPGWDGTIPDWQMVHPHPSEQTSRNELLNPVASTTAIDHGLLTQIPSHSNGHYAQDTHPTMPPPPHQRTANGTAYNLNPASWDGTDRPMVGHMHSPRGFAPGALHPPGTYQEYHAHLSRTHDDGFSEPSAIWSTPSGPPYGSAVYPSYPSPIIVPSSYSDERTCECIPRLWN